MSLAGGSLSEHQQCAIMTVLMDEPVHDSIDLMLCFVFRVCVLVDGSLDCWLLTSTLAFWLAVMSLISDLICVK